MGDRDDGQAPPERIRSERPYRLIDGLMTRRRREIEGQAGPESDSHSNTGPAEQ